VRGAAVRAREVADSEPFGFVFLVHVIEAAVEAKARTPKQTNALLIPGILFRVIAAVCFGNVMQGEFV
jgi:hypothetical protein